MYRKCTTMCSTCGVTLCDKRIVPGGQSCFKLWHECSDLEKAHEQQVNALKREREESKGDRNLDHARTVRRRMLDEQAAGIDENNTREIFGSDGDEGGREENEHMGPNLQGEGGGDGVDSAKHKEGSGSDAEDTEDTQLQYERCLKTAKDIFGGDFDEV